MALYPCPECQNNISDKAKTCPNCGAVWAGVCPECQMFRDPSAELCSGCGYPFSSAKRSIDEAEPVAINSAGIGKFWLNVWTYFCLPAAAFVSAIYGGLAIWTSVNYYDLGSNTIVFYDSNVLSLIGITLVSIAFYLVCVAVGVAKRRHWAFQANWVAVYLVCLIFFADFLDSLIKDDPFASQTGGLLVGVLASAIWLVPNHIFWRKREVCFS